MPKNEDVFVDEVDIAIMRVIDGLRTVFEWIPESNIKEKLPYSTKLITKRLNKLASLRLIKYSHLSHYGENAAMLNEKGFDTLALWDFKQHNVVSQIGTEIGTGKEATIVGFLTPNNEWGIVKFHRMWAKEFQRIKKSLAYASIKVRGQALNLDDSKIDIPRAKAQVEMHALQILFSKGINVPEPLGINRHAVAMKMVEWENGIPSPQIVSIRLENPRETYEIVLEDYIKMVNDGGIVHGDFNEYNILINPDGELFYIDFPQAVPVTYPGVMPLLIRDITQINRYFSRKYHISVISEKEILDMINIPSHYKNEIQS